MTPTRAFPAPPGARPAPRTVYRLVRPGEYQALHRLAAEAGLPGGVYQWPTIVVERDGALIGFAASRYHGQRLIVGPVVVAPSVRMRGIICIRAVFAIEAILKEAGVRYFLISTIHPGVKRICQALGYLPQGEHDGAEWWLRLLTPEDPSSLS